MDSFDTDLKTPSIPITYSRIAARVLKLSEKNLEQLLFRTGLTTEQFLQDEFLLNSKQQLAIYSNALDISGDEAFGLHYGQQLTPATHGPLGFLVYSSPNLFAALEAFQDYLPLRMHLTQLDIQTTDKWIECRLLISPAVTEKVYRIYFEALSLAALSIIESILGRPLHEGSLSASFSAPSYQNRYKVFYPCSIKFSEPENILRIPKSLIYTSNATANHENYEHALLQCRELIDKLSSSPNTTHTQVRRILLSNTNHQLSENEVAKALFISRRTLARRLEEENTSFRQVRDTVLIALSESYLSNTTMSVEAVAQLLNYHDASNFRRAFKRWKAITPETFRAQLNDQSDVS
ncbi:AraC family transcriptional regulator [Spongiibacter sp. UBA1325]|jgi:AraC-like DNA-binding protein|uniref:AraC family transcriptional regulator n=1 Tax=Spongiibacter sp. UBA1325 TaxID=1947543 RepID=UPI00257C41C4|nr:AraC family transcriptional regulator [Spongiibacter sp. UBA1325]|tara:strand:- start:5659 stop:6708 length:1050 start_codon:yes stop_codon:yes gene_type:complete